MDESASVSDLTKLPVELDIPLLHVYCSFFLPLGGCEVLLGPHAEEECSHNEFY